MIEINITPVAKPRMTRADKWKKRPVVQSYWSYKDELTLKCNLKKVELGETLNVEFHLPMPKSWTKKDREESDGMPHMQTPDLDNLVKGLQDCLLKQDKKIHKIQASKFWSKEGKIVFK